MEAPTWKEALGPWQLRLVTLLPEQDREMKVKLSDYYY